MRRAAVVEPRARISRVVQVHAVDRVAAGQIANDRFDVRRGARLNRRGVKTFDPLGLRARPSREPAHVRGTGVIDLASAGASSRGTISHSGWRCTMCVARDRQIDRARHQVDVDPRVNAEAAVACGGDHGRADRNSRAAAADPTARGSMPPEKYASPRPRTWTSSVLNPFACADFTSAAIDAGVSTTYAEPRERESRMVVAVRKGNRSGRQGLQPRPAPPVPRARAPAWYGLR